MRPNSQSLRSATIWDFLFKENNMKLQLAKPLCCFDLETTGLDVDKDRIVEISVIKLGLNGDRDVKTKRVNPQMPISPTATERHGITDEMVKDCPTFAQIAKGVLDFISGCDIAGYNINNFDLRILNNEFARVGIEWDYSGVNFIDVCNIARRKEPRNLSWATRFYCDKVHDDAHSAESDANTALDVLLAQSDMYSDLPNNVAELAFFSNYDKPMLDLSGKLSLDADGDVVFTFGKHRNEKVKDNFDYAKWMIGADFGQGTKRILRKILES
jgi:DNA polymerase-3 subunit epsilon